MFIGVVIKIVPKVETLFLIYALPKEDEAGEFVALSSYGGELHYVVNRHFLEQRHIEVNTFNFIKKHLPDFRPVEVYEEKI